MDRKTRFANGRMSKLKTLERFAKEYAIGDKGVAYGSGNSTPAADNSTSAGKRSINPLEGGRAPHGQSRRTNIRT